MLDGHEATQLGEGGWCCKSTVVRGSLVLLCVTVVAGHQSLKACHEAKAALEVYKGAHWMGWLPRDGAEGASRSAHPRPLSPASRSTAVDSQARRGTFLTSA